MGIGWDEIHVILHPSVDPSMVMGAALNERVAQHEANRINLESNLMGSPFDGDPQVVAVPLVRGPIIVDKREKTDGI